MPQTITGWILLAANIISGISAGSTGAGMLGNALGHRVIAHRDFITFGSFFSLMAASGVLLWLVEGP